MRLPTQSYNTSSDRPCRSDVLKPTPLGGLALELGWLVVWRVPGSMVSAPHEEGQ
jgi:hypothetical protein